MPRATVPLPDASTRIDASTVPMHGAAQTANAPPSSAFDPRRRACCSSPGATVRSGHGSSPMNASPITTSTKPAILICVCLSTVLADRGRAGAEQHEDGREAEDERDARDARSAG